MTHFCLFFGLLVTIFAHATEAPFLDPKAPAFQCQIGTTKAGIFNGFCSGTYLNNWVFLTAGHCFEDEESGSTKTAKARYEVKCFDQPSREILAIAFHPQYFKVSGGYRSRIKEYDMAIAITEPNDLRVFPSLPDEDQPSVFVSDSCRMLGFSDFYCQDNGYGCYRENFSLRIPDGDGEAIPTMLQVSSKDSKYAKIRHGDSGSGMLCLDRNGREILAGVHTNMMRLSTVNVTPKLAFIKKFMSLSLAEGIFQSDK